jgi:hypothetical protein
MGGDPLFRVLYRAARARARAFSVRPSNLGSWRRRRLASARQGRTTAPPGPSRFGRFVSFCDIFFLILQIGVILSELDDEALDGGWKVKEA